jgi:putative component of membrane protein insertase Oxa1/YidC/SpoIIIJ protein YidD
VAVAPEERKTFSKVQVDEMVFPPTCSVYRATEENQVKYVVGVDLSLLRALLHKP